jgi:PRC-barrel domain protein
MEANDQLCYLDASRVNGPTGQLDSVDLLAHDDEPLGSLDGVLIDPTERRLRYFVVEKPGWFRRRRYLVPAEEGATVERSRNALRLKVAKNELSTYEEFDTESVREFSDEDLVTAMFAQRKSA